MRRGFGWALFALGVVGLVAANRVALAYWDFGAASGELPETARAYRAAGLPWTAADLKVPVRPDENAAPQLRQAISALPKGKAILDFESSILDRRWVGPPASTESAMRLAHLAAQKPKLDFGRDWDLGLALVMPEPGKVKASVRMLAARAVVRARSGDDAGALADLDDARRLSALIGQEPTVISALVDAACDGIVMKAAQECLIAAYARPSLLVHYRTWLARAAPVPDLRRAYRGAIYDTVVNSRNFDQLGVGQGLVPASDMAPFADTEEDMRGDYRHDPTIRVPRREGFPGNTRTRAYMARCLQRWIELARRTHGLTDPIEKIIAESQTIADREARVKGLSHFFDPILFPVFSQFGRTNRTLEASRAVSLAFADALILHVRTGRWPTAVAATDPLGTGPLRVRSDHGRFRVWSVGRDGKDDGGLARWESGRSDDIAAAYPPISRVVPHKFPAPAGFED